MLTRLEHPQARIDAVLAHNLGSMAAVMLGRVAEATEHVRLGIAGADLLRLPVSRVQLRWMSAELTAWAGDLPAAVERFDQAYEIHLSTELYVHGVRELCLVTLAWDADRLAELDLGPIDNPALAWLGAVGQVARRTPGAAEVLADEVAREEPVIWTTHGRWTLLAHLVADQERADLAPVLVGRLTPLSGRIANVGQVGNLGPVDLALARLHLLLGDEAPARSSLATAIEICAATPARRHLLRCRVLEHRLDGGDPAPLLAEAARLDMPWLAAAVRAGAADTGGVRVRPGG